MNRHVFIAINNGVPGWSKICVDCGGALADPQHSPGDMPQEQADEMLCDALIRAMEGGS